MSNIKETIFAGRSNVIRLQLSEDSQLFHEAYPDVTPTRWVLTIYAAVPIVVDSDVTASAFDWDETISVLELRLGSLVTDLLAYTNTSLVMYSAEWPLGIVWANPTCTPDKLQVRICTFS